MGRESVGVEEMTWENHYPENQEPFTKEKLDKAIEFMARPFHYALVAQVVSRSMKAAAKKDELLYADIIRMSEVRPCYCDNQNSEEHKAMRKEYMRVIKKYKGRSGPLFRVLEKKLEGKK